MTAVKAHEVERALKARRPSVVVLLFYGPDAGRVSERARDAAAAAASDADDPFAIVRLDGDLVADEPGRLVEEATTFSLFGGRRVVSVRATARSLAPAVRACLEVAPDGALVVVEAGDLARNAPLRTLCEASDRALALPCYADEGKDLATVVDGMLAAEGQTMDAAARALLLESLGGDRLASRGEVAKLLAYAGPGARITEADVEAVVSDVSAPGLDPVVDAAFGDLAALASGLGQMEARGQPAGALLSAALRHALALATARAAADEGGGVEAGLRTWRGLSTRRRDAVARQVGAWPSPALRRVVGALQDATRDSRLHAGLAGPLAAAALLRVGQAAGRRGER